MWVAEVVALRLAAPPGHTPLEMEDVNMSKKNVLVLGGNFAGLTAALSVKHRLENEVNVTVLWWIQVVIAPPSVSDE